MERHSIGWAMDHILQGRKVMRSGWNGKGMYVYMRGCHTAMIDGKEVYFERQLCIHPVSGDDIAWTISQADAFAEDWELYEG